MPLVSIETFNDNAGTVVITEDKKIVIDSEAESILIICKDYATTPAGAYDKDFTMVADNTFLVPVVDAEGNPVYENPEAPEEQRIQKTIGEWTMLKLLIDNQIITFTQAVAGAILRRKGIDTSPYVFRQV